jgi:hypothetical protein
VGRVNVVVDGQAELATEFLATGNCFRVLGINARLGRVFVPEDDRPTAPPVASISDRSVNNTSIFVQGRTHESGVQAPTSIVS